MRHVLAQRCWSYIGNGGHSQNNVVPPALVGDRVALSKLVDVFSAKKHNWKNVRGGQRAIHNVHVDAIRRCGGFLALQCSILYRAYRLCMDSVGIAEDLDITPGMARQALARANAVARKLGYECGSRHWTVGTKQPHKLRVRKVERIERPRRRYAQIDAVRAAELRTKGWPWDEIAVTLGASSGANVLTAVQNAGLFVPKKKGRNLSAPAPVRTAA
jgi:hypothetical protein